MKDIKAKILLLDELADKVASLKKAGRKVVQSHGIFDLVHPGVINHLSAARKLGDALVVTVVKDKDVRRGPGRPIFEEKLRAESIAALACVDYVAINKWPTAEQTLRLVRPDFYVKGQEFEKLEDKTGKIQREFEVVKEVGAQMRFTHEIVFSSTELLNKFFIRKP